MREFAGAFGLRSEAREDGAFIIAPAQEMTFPLHEGAVFSPQCNAPDSPSAEPTRTEMTTASGIQTEEADSLCTA